MEYIAHNHYPSKEHVLNHFLHQGSPSIQFPNKDLVLFEYLNNFLMAHLDGFENKHSRPDLIIINKYSYIR